MRLPRLWLVAVWTAAGCHCWLVQQCAGEEAAVKSTIVSVGLFKNGLSVVRRELKIPAAGTYLVEDAPDPVHGTWSVQSDIPIETRVTMREVSGAMRGTNVDFQRALAGKAVTIHFRDGQIPPATGKVEAIAPAKGDEAWNRTYQQPAYYWREYNQQPQPQGRFLVLQTENGRVFVEPSMIAYLKAEGKEEAVKQREPVLLITAGKATTVQISYLSRGLAWAPSYRVDIGDPKTLTIEQTAVIKNELDDIEGAEMQLISGFPSMQFAHVVSPLSLRTNWTNFFQQLNQRVAPGHAAGGNVAMQQARVMDNEPAPGAVDLAATPAGEGVDLHYQSLGPRTLKEGDAMALSIAKESAPYERIVEWLIPDTRSEYGQFIQDYQRQQEPDKYQDAAWDAVRFKNPFKFAMTTGVAVVVSGARFNGQQMSYWVNAGEETTVKVTKALSIRTRNVEQEEEGQREVIYIGGRQFRKPVVNGEMSVNNHRKEEVKLVIRRHFSGELISADGEPKKSLREEGVYAVNPRYELTWSFSLKPGEGTTLKYKYSVLVAH
ncbi:MAG: hypothetical protein NTW87_30175 [Planctomycetota bacterium]|nr:hypothetical protein [Planctomycetota bacterium]